MRVDIYFLSQKYVRMSHLWIYWVIKEWIDEHIKSLNKYSEDILYWKDQIEEA